MPDFMHGQYRIWPTKGDGRSDRRLAAAAVHPRVGAGDDAMAPAPQSREEGNEVDAQATAALALRGSVHAMVHGLSVRRGQQAARV
jgi:hypothetical protein